MKRIISGMVLFLPIIILTGCEVNNIVVPGPAKNASVKSAAGAFVAVEWNVQALFDGDETGNEYGEYLEKAGWTKEKYAARITAITQAFRQMSDSEFPALIGFVEIENAAVLEDLAGGMFSKKSIVSAAFTTLPGSSLGIGFLSLFPFKEIRAHSITIGKNTAPRPVLEVRIEPDGKPLVFLLCHWKSKLGGDEATEHIRHSSARVIQRRLRELNAAEPGTPVIVMGDLNENHDEFYRRDTLSALLPDDARAANLAGRSVLNSSSDESVYLPDTLILSGEKPPQTRHFRGPALYSPWYGEFRENSDGSFYYRGDWETIDHFLLSEELFNGRGWEYEDCRVLNHAPFAAASGAPAAYNPRSGRGLSDHLPLALFLRDVDVE